MKSISIAHKRKRKQHIELNQTITYREEIETFQLVLFLIFYQTLKNYAFY